MFQAINNNCTVEYKIDYETQSIYETVFSVGNRSYTINFNPTKEFLSNKIELKNHNINKETSTVMDNQIYFKEFKYLYDKDNDDMINLRLPLILRIEVEKDGFYYINEKYSLYVYGATQIDAEESIINEIRALYTIYALESDDNLDNNAKLLKYSLIDLLGEKGA